MEGIPRHWSLEIFMSQVKVWIPLQISSPIMTNFRSYFWPCLYHVSVIHSMLETRTSSCINITQPSSQFPTQWGATTRNFRPFQKDYGATAGQPAWIPRAEGWENFFNKDLLMNKNCHWIHLPFFFFGGILRQCEDLWNGKRCKSGKIWYLFFQWPKMSEVTLSESNSEDFIPTCYCHEVKPNRPRRFGVKRTSVFQQVGDGEARLVDCAGFVSCPCCIACLCRAPQMSKNWSTASSRWRKPQKKLRPWAVFCAVFWVLCLDQRQVFFVWQVQNYNGWMDGWLRWDLSICVICIQPLRMSWRQADGHFLETLSSEWSLCSLASRGCDLDPCFVLALLRIQAYHRAFVAFLCNCMRFHALRSPTKTLVRCLQFFALGRQACGS